MSSESEKLRALAQALDELEAAETWVANKDNIPNYVFVDWSAGSTQPGYQQIKTEMSRLVAERYPTLLYESLQRLRGKVEEKRKDLESGK